MKALEDLIMANRKTFVAFVRNRIGDAHLAEDLVQESLVKALASDRQPANEKDTVAWFYRILRNAIIDLYRRQDTRTRALERLKQEIPEVPDAEETRLLCQCFLRLLPAIPKPYQEVLQRIDLDGETIHAVAADLELTKNNVTVRLHRARQHLRDQLIRTCGACSQHGCLDCSCGESV